MKALISFSFYLYSVLIILCSRWRIKLNVASVLSVQSEIQTKNINVLLKEFLACLTCQIVTIVTWKGVSVQ